MNEKSSTATTRGQGEMTRRAWNSTLNAPEKPMKRTTRLRAKMTLKAKGGSRFPKRRSPAYRAWIREQPCTLAGVIYHTCNGRVECAHVRSQGAGAYDIGECVPLCSSSHRWAPWSIHTMGIKSFEAKYHMDLATVAATLALKYNELAA